MAISENCVWEVRTTGAAANGGGFVTGASGVDYSQQDAAQATYTDLVLATTTTLSSVARPFVANDVGNILNITGGTGFTQGRYEITAVNAGVATVDRAAGTLSSTGGQATLGGAVSYPTIPLTAIAGNSDTTIWIRQGTYTMSVDSYNVVNGKINSQTSPTAQVFISGYGTTRGDDGIATIDVTTAMGSTDEHFVLGNDKSMLRNVHMISSNSASNGRHLVIRGNGSFVIGCSFDDAVLGILLYSTRNYVINCNVSNCTSPIGIVSANTEHLFFACVFDTCGVVGEAANHGGDFINCIAKGGTADGFEGGHLYVNCIAVGNVGDGFSESDTTDHRAALINCIAVDNGGYGFLSAFDNTNINSRGLLINCAGQGNDLGEVTGTWVVNQNYTTITDDVFADPLNDDYTIISTELPDGYPSVWKNFGTVTNFVIGAVAGAGGGGGAGGASNHVPGILFE